MEEMDRERIMRYQREELRLLAFRAYWDWPDGDFPLAQDKREKWTRCVDALMAWFEKNNPLAARVAELEGALAARVAELEGALVPVKVGGPCRPHDCGMFIVDGKVFDAYGVNVVDGTMPKCPELVQPIRLVPITEAEL